ncbi:cytochrome P450 [Streptomyces sp. NPDC047014]|uniref:cytochrome P450 n=1 Tax=Streptomyces sp. NPDC047014 TaxID=3155736 RepID=UPI0033E6DD92
MAVVLPGGVRAWAVNRQADIRRLLVDPRVSKDAYRHWPAWIDGEVGAQWPLAIWVSVQNMITAYGHEHARLRRPVAGAFTARRVAAMRPRIEEITEGLLDRLEAAEPGGAVDLRAEFAHELPTRIVFELFGIPERSWAPLHKIIKGFFDTGISAEDARQNAADLDVTMADLVAHRRAHPGDDLTSALIAARDHPTGADPGTRPDTDPGAHAAAGAAPGAGTGADAAAGLGAGLGAGGCPVTAAAAASAATGPRMDLGSGDGVAAGVGPEAGIRTAAATGPRTGAAAAAANGVGVEAGSGAGAGPVTAAATASGSRIDAGAGIGVPAGVGAGAGPEAGGCPVTDTAAASGSRTGSGAGDAVDAGPGADPGAGTGVAAEAGPEAGACPATATATADASAVSAPRTGEGAGYGVGVCPVSGGVSGSGGGGEVRLSEKELVDNLILLFTAGYETSANLICTALYELLAHPEQLALVREGLASWEDVVEEALRVQAPAFYGLLRFAVEDIDMGEGVVIGRGDPIIVSFGAAGRDPAVHGADAARFDVTRSTRGQHLSFGFGTHHCLGATLARAECAIALRRFFERFPRAVLQERCGAGELARVESFISNGLRELPVLLAPEGGTPVAG